jgi:hypothetical protein
MIYFISKHNKIYLGNNYPHYTTCISEIYIFLIVSNITKINNLNNTIKGLLYNLILLLKLV